ncbi:MAG: hypothetical protein ACTSVU_03975 [Promethearchaeota archaeon]
MRKITLVLIKSECIGDYQSSDKSDEIFEDAVIFGLSSSKPEKKEIRIVNSGKEINEQIMDNFNAFMTNLPEIPGC